MKNLFRHTASIPMLLTTLLAVTSCRTDDEYAIPSQRVPAHLGDHSFYLLNEGAWGSNKSTLDYYDATTSTYIRNIYAEANPGIAHELGDVGNDLKIYDDKLWAVINNSHLIEVMDASTAKHITQISIPNCRYITFVGHHAYVTSYAGPAGIDPNAQLGYVARIDTRSMVITDTCLVGYQPDDMALCANHLYVANSGGYRYPDYDNTISVIDLETFTVTDTIEVAFNLARFEVDSQGYLWASARGDYYGRGSKTYVIDPRTNTVCDSLDVPNTGMALAGDSLYIYSAEWNYTTNASTNTYYLVNTRTRQVVTNHFINDGTELQIRSPYGIAVNPDTRDIYIADAADYINPGLLYCYGADGIKKGEVRTGDIPAHFAFTQPRTSNTNIRLSE